MHGFWKFLCISANPIVKMDEQGVCCNLSKSFGSFTDPETFDPPFAEG